LAPLNKDLPVPLYHQLKCVLMNAIRTGHWHSDERLPTESELAETFRVSKITVRQALQGLAELGYIRREQGRGTFVAAVKLDQGPRELTSFTEELRRRRLAASSTILEQAVVPADEETAAALAIAAGEPVVRLKRLRLADGQPMGVQTAHIPSTLAPGLESEDLRDVSLYDLLAARYGLHPARAREKHVAVAASPADAALLGVDPGSPAFAAERVTHLADGRPFEFVRSIMRGDRYSIVLELAADRATTRLAGEE